MAAGSGKHAMENLKAGRTEALTSIGLASTMSGQLKSNQNVVEMTEMILVEQIQAAPGNFAARYDTAG
jgi:hypothetical protein